MWMLVSLNLHLLSNNIGLIVMCCNPTGSGWFHVVCVYMCQRPTSHMCTDPGGPHGRCCVLLFVFVMTCLFVFNQHWWDIEMYALVEVNMGHTHDWMSVKSSGAPNLIQHHQHTVIVIMQPTTYAITVCCSVVHVVTQLLTWHHNVWAVVCVCVFGDMCSCDGNPICVLLSFNQRIYTHTITTTTIQW